MHIISDPPEVRVDSPWVHTGIGASAHLECVVQGNPQPEVSEAFLLCKLILFVYSSAKRPLYCSRLRVHNVIKSEVTGRQECQYGVS